MTPRRAKIRSAAAYVRISKDDPASTSIEKQERGIEKYLAEHAPDATVTVFRDEGVSGSKDVKRPGRDALEARLGDFDLLVVFAVDRLARSVVDLHRIVASADAAGTRFASASQPSVETVTPIGKAMLGLLAIFAALEADTTAQRVKATNDLRRSKGSRAAGGPAGFGFVRVGDGLRPDPKTAPLVVAAVESILDGSGGIRSVAQTWTRSGVPTPRGGSEWNHRTVAKILRSPALFGAMVDRSSPSGVLLADDGLPLVDHDQALVDADTWHRLQEILEERTVGRRVSDRGRGPLHGLARCDSCGGPLYSHRTERFPDRISCHSLACTRSVSISEGALEAFVVEALVARHGDDPVVDTVTASGTDEGRLTTIRAEIAKALESIRKAAPSERAALLARVETLSAAEAAEIERADETVTREVDVFDSVVEGLEATEGDADLRRRLLSDFVSEVRLRPGKRGGAAVPASERAEVVWA
jgi:DNA invertase Pin-like site-specific DNA recombinase